MDNLVDLCQKIIDMTEVGVAPVLRRILRRGSSFSSGGKALRNTMTIMPSMVATPSLPVLISKKETIKEAQ